MLAFVLPRSTPISHCLLFYAIALLIFIGPVPSHSQETDAPSDGDDNESAIPIGDGGLGKSEGDICYSGHCTACKIDSDGACLDCTDDPTCKDDSEDSFQDTDDDVAEDDLGEGSDDD